VKSHTVAHCVANHLHKEIVWWVTVEKFMLKKAIDVKMTKRFIAKHLYTTKLILADTW
jgi:hypothetical protein